MLAKTILFNTVIYFGKILSLKFINTLIVKGGSGVFNDYN